MTFHSSNAKTHKEHTNVGPGSTLTASLILRLFPVPQGRAGNKASRIQHPIIKFTSSSKLNFKSVQINDYPLLIQVALRKLYMRLHLFLSSLIFTMNGRRMTGNRATQTKIIVCTPLLVCSTLATSLTSHSACLPLASQRR